MESLGSAIVFNFENYRLCPKEIASTTSFVEAVSLDQIRSPKIDWDLEKTVCTIVEDGQERRCMVSLKDQNHFVAMNKKRLQAKGICWTEGKDFSVPVEKVAPILRSVSSQTHQCQYTVSSVSTPIATPIKQVTPSIPASATVAANPPSGPPASFRKRYRDCRLSVVDPPVLVSPTPSRPKRPSTVQSYAVMDHPYASESDSGESVEGVPKVQRRKYSSSPRDRHTSRSRNRTPRTNFSALSPLAAKAIMVTGSLGEQITLEKLTQYIANARSQAEALRLAMCKLFSLDELKNGMSLSINVLREEDVKNMTHNGAKMHLVYAAVVDYRKGHGLGRDFPDRSFDTQCRVILTKARTGKLDDDQDS